MKRFILHLTVAILALAPAVAARAQQQDDLDVTMKVVPADASAGSAMSEIKLPDAASNRAQDASAFGQATASKAHEMKGELGRDFGQSVSEAARAKGGLGRPAGKGPVR
jgi:opacity protein-like surface antigen